LVGHRRQEPNCTTSTVHFACFDCRKAFKQRGSSNWDPAVPLRPFPCPNCKKPMTRLGRYFKTPPQRAVREWLKIELLYHYGERFEREEYDRGGRFRNLASTLRNLTSPGNPANQVRERLEQIRVSHKNLQRSRKRV